MRYLFAVCLVFSGNVYASNEEFFAQLRLTWNCHKAILAETYKGGVTRCDEVAEIMEYEKDTAQILRIIAKKHNLVFVQPEVAKYTPENAPIQVYNRYKNVEGVVITTGPGSIMFDTSAKKR